MNEVICLIGVILVIIGVIFIYDARIITKRFFGFGDQNDAVKGMKVLGLVISLIGGLVIYFVI